jgi:hypothetical protein
MFRTIRSRRNGAGVALARSTTARKPFKKLGRICSTSLTTCASGFAASNRFTSGESSWPGSQMSSVRSPALVVGAGAEPRTNVPRPMLRSSSPSAARSVSALLSVLALTLNRTASARSPGSFPDSSPLAIAARSFSRSRWNL